MLGYKKNETIITAFILVVLGVVVGVNLHVSFRKSRDVQRRGDLRAISDALTNYQIDYASFPAAENGRLVACFSGIDEMGIPQHRACDWGVDGISNFIDGTPKQYMEKLPEDPYHADGVTYRYESNGRRFQLFAALEGTNEDEYDQAIVSRNLSCGTKTCNTGMSFEDTPLDRTIEEYENELRMEQAK